jgi:hypothetical protein
MSDTSRPRRSPSSGSSARPRPGDRRTGSRGSSAGGRSDDRRGGSRPAPADRRSSEGTRSRSRDDDRPPRSAGPKGPAKGPGKGAGKRPARGRVAEAPKGWGSVARHGGKVVRAEPVPEKRPPRRRPARPAAVEEATAALRAGEPAPAAAERPRPDKPRVASLPPRAGVVGVKAGAKATKPRPRRTKDTIGARPPLPGRPAPIEDLGTSLTRSVGARRVPRMRSDLDTAARAFDAEHYAEALRTTRGLVDLAPDVPELRELHGLTLYRLGRWREAIVQLEAFRLLTGTADQNHVLADCYRALRRWDDVDDLWEELRSVSPNAEVVNEGRIVVAGSRADRGDLGGAIRLLEKGWRLPARPQDHHLRRAYALADLYERSGQAVRARELFRWVLQVDRSFADVAERVRTLG